ALLGNSIEKEPSYHYGKESSRTTLSLETTKDTIVVFDQPQTHRPGEFFFVLLPHSVSSCDGSDDLVDQTQTVEELLLRARGSHRSKIIELLSLQCKMAPAGRLRADCSDRESIDL